MTYEQVSLTTANTDRIQLGKLKRRLFHVSCRRLAATAARKAEECKT